MWQVKGRLRRVIDGDTFICDLDLGWNFWLIAPEKGSSYGTIRVLGLHCPEMRQPGGPEARKYAVELLPFGSIIKLASHELDSFGRSLAQVTLPDGRDFAATMISAGHGTV